MSREQHTKRQRKRQRCKETFAGWRCRRIAGHIGQHRATASGPVTWPVEVPR